MSPKEDKAERSPIFQIDYLADHLEFVPELARCHFAEWSYLRPGETLEGRTERLRSCCNRRSIPTVVVAFEGELLLGSAMIVAHDMDTRMDLSPWLAGVFVVKDYRRKGIGSALVQRIVEEAGGLQVSRLYLYTPTAERLYVSIGWSLLERVTYRGVDVAIMAREI